MDFESMKLFLVGAAVLESLWQAVKPLWEPGKRKMDVVGPMALSVVVFTLTQVDVFPALGMPIKVPMVGPVLTGVMFSRGAQVIHDLLGIVEKWKAK